MVTLLGPGGVGKTTLARAILGDARVGGVNGGHFVDVLSAVALALSVTLEAARPAAARLGSMTFDDIVESLDAGAATGVAADMGNYFVASVARMSLASELSRAGERDRALDTYAVCLHGYLRHGNLVHALTALRDLVEPRHDSGDTRTAVELVAAISGDTRRVSYGAQAERLPTVVERLRGSVVDDDFEQWWAAGATLGPYDTVRLAAAALDRPPDACTRPILRQPAGNPRATAPPVGSHRHMNTTSRTPWPAKGTTVVTDAGLETWLLFQRGVDLPAFAAYPLAATETGRALLTEYLQHYAAIASAVGASPVLDAALWRANPDWAAVLGHDLDTLGSLIDACIGVVADVRTGWHGDHPFLIDGPVGPRGDGYRVDDSMTPEAAADYHGFQVDRMAAAGVDVVTALTMGYVGEAAGVALAAKAAGVPVVVSFTLETDGRLPTGMPLGEAIEATDAATGAYPLHYMINCAHPTHFDHVLDPAAPWTNRIGGIRANASALSHAELDEMVELDEGDPDDLARRYVALRDRLPALHVVGGCCGTDHRHVAAIATAWQR